MGVLQKLREMVRPAAKATHLTLGERGELAARKFLRKQGMKFLTANYRTPRGELDLVFRDKDCLVFIEVKTRSSEDWERPAAAVDRERRRRLTRAALDYLRAIRNPQIKVRFDIVEVLMGAEKHEIRHLPNAFAMERPYRYAV
jgi:putative endonuclease